MSILLFFEGFDVVCMYIVVTLYCNYFVVEASTVRNDWTGLEGKEPRLLLHTCLLLHSQDKLDEFFRYVQYLLFGQLPPHIVVEHELGKNWG